MLIFLSDMVKCSMLSSCLDELSMKFYNFFNLIDVVVQEKVSTPEVSNWWTDKIHCVHLTTDWLWCEI